MTGMIVENAFEDAMLAIGRPHDEFNHWHLDEGNLRHFLFTYLTAVAASQPQDVVERVARAICTHECGRKQGDFDSVCITAWANAADEYREEARIVLAAMPQPVEVDVDEAIGALDIDHDFARLAYRNLCRNGYRIVKPTKAPAEGR
jgi:hypothetical protein